MMALAPLAALLLACAPTLRLYETAPVQTTLRHEDLPQAHELWRQRIDAARERIDLAQFYAVDEPPSRLTPVVEAIERALARGVEVRFLADAGFQKTYPDLLARLAAVPGAQVRLLDLKSRTGGVLHAKYVVIDGREVLVGSQNFDWRSLEHIQELGVQARSRPIAAAYGEVFELDWALAGGADPAYAQGAAIREVRLRSPWGAVRARAVFSPKGALADPASWDLPLLLQAIGEAREEIHIQVMSWEDRAHGGETWPEFQEALAAAAARGVRVRVVVGHWNLRASRLPGMRALAAVPGVELRVATIPELAQGFLPFARVIHAKAMVVDGHLAWVGTSNIGPDYFLASRNAGLLLEGTGFAGRLRTWLLDLWESPYCAPFDPQRDYPEPRIRS